MHYGAAWGHLSCLSALADAGADCFLLTRHKETPKATALRYGHPQCVQFLNILGVHCYNADGASYNNIDI